MKMDNLSNKLSDKLINLKYKKQDVTDSYRICLVYQTLKYKVGAEKEDKYIWIDHEAITKPYQLNILNDLKRRYIEFLQKEISDVVKEIKTIK